MLQKLKIAVVVAFTIVGTVVLLPGGIASADTVAETFACADGSSDITRAAGPNHQLIVTCKSGSKIVYANADALATVTINVTCPSGQSVGSAVDAAGQPTAKYAFYCVNPGSPNSPAGPSGSTPTSTGTPVTASAAGSGYADPAATGGQCKSAGKCDLIDKYINPFINFMAALVGIAVVISIVVGGIQYASSAGDPQKVTMAKKRIQNAIIALIAFLFLYAMLQFLVPGGIG